MLMATAMHDKISLETSDPIVFWPHARNVPTRFQERAKNMLKTWQKRASTSVTVLADYRVGLIAAIHFQLILRFTEKPIPA